MHLTHQAALGLDDRINTALDPDQTATTHSPDTSHHLTERTHGEARISPQAVAPTAVVRQIRAPRSGSEILGITTFAPSS